MLINEFSVEHTMENITVDGKFSISDTREIKSFTDIVENAHANCCYPTIHLEDMCNFRIKKVIFNEPATIVIWEDGTKTIVKCAEDEAYDKEKGLALCYMKKALGNKGNYNNIFREHIK